MDFSIKQISKKALEEYRNEKETKKKQEKLDHILNSLIELGKFYGLTQENIKQAYKTFEEIKNKINTNCSYEDIDKQIANIVDFDKIFTKEKLLFSKLSLK